MVSWSSVQFFRLSWDFWTIFKNLIKIIVLVNLSAPASLAAESTAAEFTRNLLEFAASIGKTDRQIESSSSVMHPKERKWDKIISFIQCNFLWPKESYAPLFEGPRHSLNELCCDAKKNSNFVVLFIFRYACERIGQKMFVFFLLLAAVFHWNKQLWIITVWVWNHFEILKLKMHTRHFYKVNVGNFLNRNNVDNFKPQNWNQN